MRVSFVLDTFGGGGKERRCLQVIQGLNKAGFVEIQVVIINDDVAYKELYETTSSIIIIDRKNKGLNQIQTAKSLRFLLKQFHPDIVQAWGLMSAGIVLMAKPFLKFKFIASYVADVVPPKGVNCVINRLCNRVCDKIVSNSRAGLKAYKTPKSKGIVIYNGFNDARYTGLIDIKTKRQQLGIVTRHVVAMVASFTHFKDWQCYINAAKLIIRQNKDISFLAVGKGPSWDYYNELISENERPYILMLGGRNDVDELYQICDLTVLCSTMGEGVSNSIMESMAWGVPVIATNSGGTPEIITDGWNGLLLDRNDSHILSDKIVRILDDIQMLKEYGQNAAKTIQDKFLLDRMTQDYIKLYES